MFVTAAALLIACVVAASPAISSGEAVSVRMRESPTLAYPVLRSMDDTLLAHGELVQTVRGDRVTSRLVFRFNDGSSFDETIVFSQAKVFRLLSYRLIQRGRSFAKASDIFFDRASGRYRARVGDDTAEGEIDLPPDVHNGMTGLLLRNLPDRAVGRGHLIAFTPKPTPLETTLTPDGEERFFIGDESRKAKRYLVNVEVGGLKGVIASAIGKEPPDLRYWIAAGAVPTFLKFVGPMFLNGPTWRIELGAPRWAK
jgi:hypothetical protein